MTILDSYHQGQYSDKIRFLIDQRILSRDGFELSADVVLPDESGPFPTVYLRTPYESSSQKSLERGVWWAKRGYAFVSGDCRGRYESQGEFYPYHPDGKDGVDTLQWISNQPWSDGKIGMAGGSYGGLVQWQSAALDSTNISAMAAHVICDDYFSNYHYVGGAFQLGLSVMAGVTFTTNMPIPGFAEIFDSGRVWRHLPLIDMDLQTIGKKIPWYRDWLKHSKYDEYWKEIDTTHQYGNVDSPVFIRCGWFDAYPDGTFRLWNGMTKNGASEQARKGQKVLMGPWTHGEPEGTKLGDLDFGPDSYKVILEEELRWFDYWLRGIDNGIDTEPPIHLFVMGINEWRYESEWPLSRTKFTPYYFHSGGQSNSVYGDGKLSTIKPREEDSDSYEYDPERPVPTIGGNHSTASWPWTETGVEPIVVGPVEQRAIESRHDVLVYTSDPLDKDMEVTGPLEVVLYASSSALDTDFTARLTDVYPDGRSIMMAEGIIRARFRNGYTKEEFLQPGKVEEYRIQLYPTSNVFFSGHSLRVDISSSNFPRFSRNLNTGEDVGTGVNIEIASQTIFHSEEYPSHIILPLIPK